MEKPQREFGDLLKDLRKSKEVTLGELSSYLNVSLSLLSDIENKRRNPFDEDKIELIAQRLMLNSAEKAELYDLKAKKQNTVPDDVKDFIMYNPVISDNLRLAFRKTQSGQIPIEKWEQFLNSSINDDKGDKG